MRKGFEKFVSDDFRGPAGKILAVVSGKGGSGKTMIAVALAQGAALADKKVVLVDADFATGGLTYYLTFREFDNVRVGISDMLDDSSHKVPLTDWALCGIPNAVNKQWISQVRLVSIGDQRRISDDANINFDQFIQDVLSEAAHLGDLIIVDCRGGIDKHSLTVCQMADEILVVVETDTTSIRASQHLVDMLSSQKLRGKIVGFFLNKVLDNPASLAKTASSLLGISYLGSIPFDIEATRSYIQGLIPDKDTLFSRHVFARINKILISIDDFNFIEVFLPEDFGTITLKSPEIRRGGILLFIISIYLSIAYIYFGFVAVYYYYYNTMEHNDSFSASIASVLDGNALHIGFLIAFNILFILALSDSLKQAIGRQFSALTNLYSRLFRKLSRS